MQHELKTINPYFTHVFNGVKSFEIRKNDRGFKEGDILWLREYEPVPKSLVPPCRGYHTASSEYHYTGRSIKAQVTYLLHENMYPGLVEDYCCMQIKVIDREVR